MRYVVEGDFYDAEDWYLDVDWAELTRRHELAEGWEYNHRHVDPEIVKNMYAGVPAEDILGEIMADTTFIDIKNQIMGDVTISPDFSGWEDAKNWKPAWDTEWKVTSTTLTTGSPMVLPSSI
jgi:hypothetical protein